MELGVEMDGQMVGLAAPSKPGGEELTVVVKKH
jgi:hypothetical protein